MERSHPRVPLRLGLAYVAARLAWRLGAVGRHAGAPPQPVRPPIGAHHATPRSSRRADGSQWTRLPGPRPDRWRRAKTGRGRGGRYLPSPGGVLTYSEWRGTGRAGKEDTRTASREPLKRRLSGPLPMPALDKLDKHHLRPVASEQQRAGQAPSANSSDGARPAGDLHYEERRRREEEERGGGDISTRSKRCASHTPIYSLSPPPFLPLPTHRPLQLLQPALRSATQRKRGRPKRSYSHEYE